jgi:AraC-like DNA-binding protein
MEISTPRTVQLPDAPLSFWVRLAHVYGFSAHEPSRSPLRILTDFELILQLDGLSWIWSEADGGSIDIPAGSIGFVPPGFVHGCGTESGRHIAIHFDLHAQPEVGIPDNMRYIGPRPHRRPISTSIRFALRFGDHDSAPIIPLLTVPPPAQPWREQLETLVDLWSRRALRTLEGRSRVAQVLGFALENLIEPESREGPKDGRIAAVVGRLDDSMSARISVSELARMAGMGETSFRAAFTRTMGTSPRRYLEDRRIERAARALIESGLSISEISETVGYDDPFYFSRVFSRVKGMSPLQYRMRAYRRIGDS